MLQKMLNVEWKKDQMFLIQNYCFKRAAILSINQREI